MKPILSMMALAACVVGMSGSASAADTITGEITLQNGTAQAVVATVDTGGGNDQTYTVAPNQSLRLSGTSRRRKFKVSYHSGPYGRRTYEVDADRTYRFELTYPILTLRDGDREAETTGDPITSWVWLENPLTHAVSSSVDFGGGDTVRISLPPGQRVLIHGTSRRKRFKIEYDGNAAAGYQRQAYELVSGETYRFVWSNQILVLTRA